MNDYRIAYIFDMDIESDSRSQKEIYTLKKNGYKIKIFEWNKENNYHIKSNEIFIRGEKFIIDSIGIKVKKTEGIKSNLVKLIKYEYILFKWLIKNKKEYDVIHCVNFDTAFISIIVSKLFNKKIVYDVFDDYADSHNCSGKLYKFIKRLDFCSMKRCDYVIICSEKRVAQILKPLDNLVVIHNSPDIEINCINNNDNFSKKLKIAYVGNLTSNRMINELMQIVKNNNEFELHCGGGGPLQDSVIKYSETSNNIIYYGKMKYEDVIQLESKCDVIPAIYDPELKNNTFAAPNKFYEAMYLGKPTIMVHNTGMDVLVDTNNLGLTIDNNILSLEKALYSIKDNLEYWKKNSQRIKELYLSSFSWQTMERRLLDIYIKIQKEN